MLDWIKEHKWLIALAAGAVVLYFVLKNVGGGSSQNQGAQDVSGYGGYGGSVGSIGVGGSVGYSGGGVPVTGPTADAGGAAGSTPTPATAPTASNPATTDPNTTAQSGYTADGRPYSGSTDTSQIPTGPGWNQGTQPVATLGEGGTALPVASGDFTHPYLARPGDPNSAIPGLFTNAQGYSSVASYDANHAAVQLQQQAYTKGYVADGPAIANIDKIRAFLGNTPTAPAPSSAPSSGIGMPFTPEPTSLPVTGGALSQVKTGLFGAN